MVSGAVCAHCGHGLAAPGRPLGRRGHVMGENLEVRPCVGTIQRGDRVVAATSRTDGYFTVRKATPDDETALGVALTNSHALGFVAL